MMQFTETSLVLPMQQNISANSPCSSNLTKNKNHPLHHHHHHHHHQSTTKQWPTGFPTSKTLGSFGDANCMEQLLVHCATAIETNDATLAQQILWVLNNIAPHDGDSNQRLTAGFLRALIARATRTGSCKMLTAMASANNENLVSIQTHKYSIIELASFIDLTPWHRFGFSAANAAILEAIEGFSVIHIVDLSSTHCMQIPTLIDAIANRQEGHPPFIKLTVAGAIADIPPMLDHTYEELGTKLVNFARSRNVGLEFRVIPSSSADGFASLIEQLRVQQLVFADHHGGHDQGHEALVINCHMMLHNTPEDQAPGCSGAILDNINQATYSSIVPTSASSRSMFLKALRSLDPTIVVLVDEDADFSSSNLVCRLRSAFNFLWIPYDAVEAFLRQGSKQRQWYEADICWKIENVIAQEGVQRVERLEPKSKWVQRMRSANFRSIGFSEDAISEVKAMLDEHAAGWGLKKEEEDLVLTWKGHNVVFATLWVPA